MKVKFSRVAVFGAAALATGLAIAGEQADAKRQATTVHYTHVEGAFFPGTAFTSGPETYAAQEKGLKTTVTEAARSPNGHEYSLSEYLFFSGKGFSSSVN